MWAVCITFIIEELEKKLQNALHDIKVMLKWINWCNESLMILVGSGELRFYVKLMKWGF